MEKKYTPARVNPARTVYSFTVKDLAAACRAYLVTMGEMVPAGRENMWGLEYDQEFCFVVDEEDKPTE